MRTHTKSRAWHWLRLPVLALVIFYLVACALLFFFQRKLLYLPNVYSTEQVNGLAESAGLQRWTNSAGQNIGFKRMTSARAAQGSVLVMHGNGGTATGSSAYADELQRAADLNVFILEYPGYEDRPGQPTQETLFYAAREALQLLDTNQPIYLVGESLGTGVASYLAGAFPEKVAGIVLISPYHQLAEVAQSHYPWLPARWLLLDTFPSEHYLKTYHGAVGIVVDGRDTIVPEKFGRALFDGYQGPKQLWAYPDCQHIQIGEAPEKFWASVVKFWKVGGAIH